MQNKIIEIFNDSINLKEIVKNKLIEQLTLVNEEIIKVLKSNRKILICGNGGSAADAQHFTAELMVRYRNERISLLLVLH